MFVCSKSCLLTRREGATAVNLGLTLIAAISFRTEKRDKANEERASAERRDANWYVREYIELKVMHIFTIPQLAYSYNLHGGMLVARGHMHPRPSGIPRNHDPKILHEVKQYAEENSRRV